MGGRGNNQKSNVFGHFYNGGSGGLWLILRIFATHKNIIAPVQSGITSHEKDFYIIKLSRLVGTLHGLR